AYSPSSPELPEHQIDSLGIEHFRRPGLPVHPNVWRDNLQALPYSLRILPLLKPADVTSFHTPFSFLLQHKPGLGVCTHTIHRTPKWILKLHTNLDRIYGGSHAVIEQAKKISPRAARKLKAIHNCIDMPEHMPSTTLVEPLTFLFLGRFARDKGLESLIRGFLAVAPNYPTMRLRTIGPQGGNEGADVEFLAEMQALVRQDPNGARVSLEPSIYDREKLFAQIAQAAVFCLPSLSGETFSMAALEAMANAKALLVSDFGPMREMVEHGRNGYIAKAGDVPAWTAAIDYFAKNEHLIPEMGRLSFEKARAEFSSEKIAQEYLDDFRMLIEQKRSR
ncbi:MAG: glycosyltransferase family 4 protein, partial [Chthoniobacterales bacterium]